MILCGVLSERKDLMQFKVQVLNRVRASYTYLYSYWHHDHRYVLIDLIYFEYDHRFQTRCRSQGYHILQIPIFVFYACDVNVSLCRYCLNSDCASATKRLSLHSEFELKKDVKIVQFTSLPDGIECLELYRLAEIGIVPALFVVP